VSPAGFVFLERGVFMGKGRLFSRTTAMVTLVTAALSFSIANGIQAKPRLSTVDMWGVRPGKLAHFAQLKPEPANAQTESLNVQLVGRALFGAANVVAYNGSGLAFLGAGRSVIVLDASQSDTLVLRGYYDTPSTVEDIFATDGTAYIAAGYSGLRILDVSNPANPVELGAYDGSSNTEFACGIWVEGTTAYLAVGFDGVVVVDVSNPAAPAKLGTYDTGSFATSVRRYQDFLLVTDGYRGLRALDVTDPSDPFEVSYFKPENWDWVWKVDVEQAVAPALDASCESDTFTVAWVASGYSGLRAVEITHPAGRTDTLGFSELGAYESGEYAWDFSMEDTTFFLADGTGGLRALHLNTSVAPETLFKGTDQESVFCNLTFGFDTRGRVDFGREVVSVRSSGPKVLAAVREKGLFLIDGADYALTQEDHFGTAPDVKDVYVSGNTAYVCARSEGLIVLDVSDLPLPREMCRLQVFDEAWSVDADEATGMLAVSCRLGGTYLIDASSGCENLTVLSRFDFSTLRSIESRPSYGTALMKYLGRTFIVIPAATKGVQVVEVTIPTVPRFLEAMARVYSDEYAWRVATKDSPYGYLANGGNGIRVLDFTPTFQLRPDKPKVLSVWPPVEDKTVNENFFDIALSNDHSYVFSASAFTNDSTQAGVPILGRVRVFDIGGTFGGSREKLQPVTYFDTQGHAVRILVNGDSLLLGDLEDGLRIYDVSTPSTPQEVAYYDPPGNTWGISTVGPYALMSSSDNGIYIVKFGPGQLARIRSFEASPTEDGVALDWSLSSTDRVKGLNVYRIWEEGGQKKQVRVNERLISPDTVGRFLDREVDTGAEYRYRLELVSEFPSGVTTGPVFVRAGDKQASPRELLLQNYPNPFNPSTVISFTLARKARTDLKVFSVDGRLVRTLLEAETMSSGKHVVRWDGRDQRGKRVSSGIYLYRLAIDGKKLPARKMILLK